MGNPKAFLTVPRKEAGYRDIQDRIHDYGEVEQTLNSRDRQEQAGRCMDCGVPFCHWACPLGNKVPEWNDALYKGDWELAYHILERTNDFPEFTGRVCPALCEKSCVLNLSCGEPTTNREDECAIAERAFKESYIRVAHPKRNGHTVAVIGSGPAGLAAANRLNRMGYTVTVFERQEKPGGLLRYGIPNFKLSKNVIDRRLTLMQDEGITFCCNHDIDLQRLPSGFDAYVVATGTPSARDLDIPGRELKGIYPALDLLAQQNRILAGHEYTDKERISGRNKHVLVIGGGDTGSDCIGTVRRQGCIAVTQIEIMPQPPVGYNPQTPWPQWPNVLKTSSSHEEGCIRRWNLSSSRFIGQNGQVCGVEVEEVEWTTNPDSGRPMMKTTGKKEIIKADLILLAMGFLKPQLPALPENVFLAGDAATGPSLVVKCIASGQKTATQLDTYLKQTIQTTD